MGEASACVQSATVPTLRRMGIRTLAAAAAVSLAVASTLYAVEPDDRFIAGYAAAVLEREFALKAEGLVVVDGEIRYPSRGFGTLEREQLIKSLSSIPGVKKVTLVDSRVAQDPSVPKDQPVQAASSPTETPKAVAPARDEPLTLYLAPGRLFEPMLADPRWPHFYASYNYYDRSGGVDLGNVTSVGFGETIAMIRKSYKSDFRWEAGVQAGVYAIFDLDGESFDLINADYAVGPYLAMRYNDISVLTRVHHQSSHLGDEYILREDIDEGDRVNLSYEVADVLLSYEMPYGLRVYGGGGYVFHVEPSDFEPWYLQYGIEWRSPWTLGGAGGVRPVVAADLQNREESDWDLDYSIRAGFQFEDPGRFSQRMLLMFEYYDGTSPNGQFYDDRIRFYGVGLHFYF